MRASYGFYQTETGTGLIAVSERGLCALSLPGEDHTDTWQYLRKNFAELVEDQSQVEPVVQALQEYFTGQRLAFDLDLDLRGTAFQQLVWQQLCQIPYGQVKTYGEVAANLGKPKAVRAVGGACNRNPVAIVVPCHRVIGANGSLVGYAGGLALKEKLLRQEGWLPSKK